MLDKYQHHFVRNNWENTFPFTNRNKKQLREGFHQKGVECKCKTRVLVETVFTEIYPISISLLSVSGKLNTIHAAYYSYTNLKTHTGNGHAKGQALQFRDFELDFTGAV